MGELGVDTFTNVYVIQTALGSDMWLIQRQDIMFS